MTPPDLRLPLRYRAYMALARLSRRVGLRGGALLSLGIMALTYGWTLTHGGTATFAADLPWPDHSIRAIGVFFYAVGALCCGSAFTTHPSRDRPAFAAVSGACAAWGLAFIFVGSERPVARGVVFLALASLTSICARIPEAPLLPDRSLPTLPPDPLNLPDPPADTLHTDPNKPDPWEPR